MKEGQHARGGITRRQFISCGAAMAGMVALAGCSTSAPGKDGSSSAGGSNGRPTKKPKDMKITMISTAPGEVTSMQIEAMEKYAKEKGVGEFKGEYYDTKVSKEAELIEDAIQRNVDALIIFNQNATDCTDTINEAVKQGVVVLLYLTDIPKAKYTLLYAEDGREAGHVEAEVAAKWVKENLVSKGIPVYYAMSTFSISSAAVVRYEGAKERFQKLVPDAHFVGSYEATYQDQGVKMGEDILVSHPEVNVIFTECDQATIGVIEAYRAAGKNGNDVAIFGIDGTPQALRELKKNDMFKGTVETPTNKIGRKLVQAAIDIVGGSKKYPIGGRTKIVWKENPITIDNVDDYKEVLAYHYKG